MQDVAIASSSVAGIVTAVVGVLAFLTAVVTLLAVLIPLVRQVKEVHKIVNQQRTDMTNYTRALVRALSDHGIDIPIDQSLEDPRA
jgi:hypothetical protein